MRCDRTTHWIVFFMMIAVFGLSACNYSGRSSYNPKNDIDFDTIVVNEKYYLGNNANNDRHDTSCNISLRFVYPKNARDNRMQELQRMFVRFVFGTAYDSLLPHEAATQYVQNYIDNYKADAATYRKNVGGDDQPDAAALYGEDLNSPIFYSYYESLSDSITFNSYKVLSFQVKQSNNKGGAMSYKSYRNYVINLKTGKLITENDIFNPGYDTALRPLFINSLLKQNQVKGVKELEELGYFGMDEIMPNKNFLVGEKGITYTFNKGEYSAYQLNAPEIFIPYSDILSLLRENTVVYKLADS